MDELAWAGATKLAQAIRTREISSRELLEATLQRAEALNPKLNAIVCWRTAQARSAADAADKLTAKGESSGPLHGVPMTVKESFDIEGLPSTFGFPDFAHNIASSNSAVVTKLIAAGAVVYGKTNVPYALGDFQTYNAIYGTTRNPWDLTRTPGGSSGGSAAAVAAGLSPLEMGSDIGGSLRSPAHYCGVYAHKPTHGIVDSRGHAPPGVVASPDIAVCGPLARHAEDLELALEIIAGAHELERPGWQLTLPPARPTTLREFRVAVWADDPASPVDADVAARLQALVRELRRLGVTISETARPEIDPNRQHEVYMQLLRAVTTSRRPDSEYEESLRLVSTLASDDRSHRAYYIRGMVQSHRSWVRANEERTRMRYMWRRFFQDFDVLICPISPVAAFAIEQGIDKGDRHVCVNGELRPYMDSQLFWSGLTGVCYLPSTAVPVGLTPSGLPVGVQVVSAELQDRTCLAFARMLAAEIGGCRKPSGI